MGRSHGDTYGVRVPRTLSAATSLDHRLLIGTQAALGSPGVVATARGLSFAGEHAAAWLLLASAGAVLDRSRRRQWLRAGAAVLVAHAISVGLKRVVRRRRPVLDGVTVHAPTASTLSFPSSHATSTTAAAVALSPLAGPWLWPVAGAMGLARVVLGVHHPSDVAAGAVLGAAVAAAARRPS